MKKLKTGRQKDRQITFKKGWVSSFCHFWYDCQNGHHCYSLPLTKLSFSPISSFPLIHPLNPAGTPLILLTVKPIGHSLWEAALNRSHQSPTGLCYHSKPKDLTRHISLTLLLASIIAEVFSPGCTSLSPETLKYPNAQATVRPIIAEPQAWDSGIKFFFQSSPGDSNV